MFRKSSINTAIENYKRNIKNIDLKRYVIEDDIAKYCYHSQKIIEQCKKFLLSEFDLDKTNMEDIFNAVYMMGKLAQDYTEVSNFFDDMLVEASYGEFWLEDLEDKDLDEFAKIITKKQKLLNKMLSEIEKL